MNASTSSSSLVLTEKAVKHHAKRLRRELSELGLPLSLGQSQTLLAKAFGQPDFHALQFLLDQAPKPAQEQGGLHTTADLFQRQKDQVWNGVHQWISLLEDKTKFVWLLKDGTIKYLPHDEVAYVFQKGKADDFQQIVAGLTSLRSLSELKAYFKEAQKYEGPHLLFVNCRPVNPFVKRHLVVQLYFDRALRIQQIKFLTSYVNTGPDGSPYSKNYPEVAHLFAENAR